jgi:hypothetical protein
MLYIEPQLLLEAIEKKDIVRLSTPIVYDDRIEQNILNLSRAILNGKDEALCNELLLSLTDSLIQTDLSTDYKKEDTLIRKAKDMLHIGGDSTVANYYPLDSSIQAGWGQLFPEFVDPEIFQVRNLASGGQIARGL